MKNGPHFLGVLLGSGVVVLMAGCLSIDEAFSQQSAYQPGLNSKIGYSSVQTGVAEYQVIYVGNSKRHVERIGDFALLRAADLALENHFRSFVVLRRQSELMPQDDDSTPPTMSVSFNGGADPGADGASEIPTGGEAEDLKMVVLNVHYYATTPGPEISTEVYAAEGIAAALRAKYALPSPAA